jgi:hypothetical protein
VQKNDRKLSYDFVKNYFILNNCELLEKEYINANTLMEYICECQTGHRCNDCGIEKMIRSSHQYKNYIMPDKTIRRIQGYEHFALDELVKIYPENDIITDRRMIPNISYNNNNKISKIYYPDIYIPRKNLIIEVKSIFTFNINIVCNMLKSLAVRKLKYNYEYWIYKRDGTKIIV